ncbi:hypothetical protein [Terriglobus roseus]|uniref:Uncharacterized protein n=1 Tax=Terriglobus roseus TaxID=392734 RepID=A0A1G7FJG6_9BACT|nr:hypothetical protein [Terriglobus roseus]SDE76054.1 hypothetical protein SAMN05444167_0361 [Terriglobus roseus]
MPASFRHRLFVLALLLPSHAFAAAVNDDPATKPAVPAIQLPLEPFGYRPMTSGMGLRAGYTSATVHFIDADHLLLTYTAKKLIKRMPDQRETDDDHFVRALVISLPDGKVQREAEWRMHDRSPYLWALGSGRFLLRIRNNLYSLDPMGSYDPLHLGQRLLIENEDDLEALQFSPQHDLMLLETTPARKIGDDPTDQKERPVSVFFYGVALQPDGSVRLSNRGHAESKSAFTLSFTSMGVLETVHEDRTHWGFDFHGYNGAKMELGGFTSTCRPISMFISDAEFFAFGCRGGEEHKLMGGFNLLAEAKWVFTTDDEPLWLAVDNSPATGRFAVRNTLTSVSTQGTGLADSTDVRAEEIRVYGNREGDELLRVNATPVQRPAGNFALSPDGMRLAVFQGTQLSIFNLPELKPAERSLHNKEQGALAPLRPAATLGVISTLAGSSDNRTP